MQTKIRYCGRVCTSRNNIQIEKFRGALIKLGVNRPVYHTTQFRKCLSARRANGEIGKHIFVYYKNY